MSLTFDPVLHAYVLDGEAVPSVTGILKAAGLIDFSHIPPTILGAALDRGRIVHQAIHYFNERDLDVANFHRIFPEYCGYLSAWIRFVEQRSFVPVLNEYRVASRRHRVAGTLDCLGILDGAAVLLDFKSGRPADVAADLQTAAYLALAMEWALEDEELGSPLQTFLVDHSTVQRHAVQLKKDGAFAIETYAAPTDYREFFTLVAAHHILARRRAVERTWEAA